MKRKTAIGSEERNPGHAPDIREVRKPGILRLIGALMRRGFEGSSQATLGLQSSHADTRSRIFVLEPAAAIRDDWQTGPPGTPRMNCSFEHARPR
jgi:hypothetical protein